MTSKTMYAMKASMKSPSMLFSSIRFVHYAEFDRVVFCAIVERIHRDCTSPREVIAHRKFSALRALEYKLFVVAT